MGVGDADVDIQETINYHTIISIHNSFLTCGTSQWKQISHLKNPHPNSALPQPPSRPVTRRCLLLLHQPPRPAQRIRLRGGVRQRKRPCQHGVRVRLDLRVALRGPLALLHAHALAREPELIELFFALSLVSAVCVCVCVSLSVVGCFWGLGLVWMGLGGCGGYRQQALLGLVDEGGEFGLFGGEFAEAVEFFLPEEEDVDQVLLRSLADEGELVDELGPDFGGVE